MAASNSLADSVLKGFVWQMDEDGAIRQSLTDIQFGGTPVFTEVAGEHNSKVLYGTA